MDEHEISELAKKLHDFEKERIVGRTLVFDAVIPGTTKRDVLVSTVKLWSLDGTKDYETMVFDAHTRRVVPEAAVWRHSSHEQAERMHGEIVESFGGESMPDHLDGLT